MDRNVLTIATGKPLFMELAVNLARSFRYWNTDSDIHFYLATDIPHLLPDDVKDFVRVIAVEPGALGKGFTPKLHLDKLAPAGQTLFIDSDCLVYGNLNPVFEKFKGHCVSVIGIYITDGEWFGDVKTICSKFSISRLPKFNGGVYYLENGETAAAVYTTARRLETQYDEIGFVRLRERPNDEVLMALAMELHGQTPISEDGSVMAEFVNFRSGITSNLLKGEAILYNWPGNKNYSKNWALKEARPLIVHYLGFHNRVYPYIKEVKQLELIFKNRSPAAAKTITLFSTTLPFKVRQLAKNILRPLYRVLFGYRPIERSERIAD